MRLSVIIPVLNGSSVLPRCLAALAGSTRRPDQIVVVDDGSDDGTPELARSLGAEVISTRGGPLGPASARNLGAGEAVGQVLVFIDADVAVHPDTLAQIEGHFAADPGLDALFGSYDDAPPERSVASLYKNLLHHHTHQRSRPESSTFWAGCGAVRAEVFRAFGGFEAAYDRPSIEDIELGVRLRRGGRRVRSCPEVLCTHLKRWTVRSMIRTDLAQRAVPWTRLILREGKLPADLNLGWSSRVSALAAWSLPASLASAPFWWPALAASAAALGVVAALNRDFLGLLARRGGARLAVGGLGLHLLYLGYSSATFAALAGAHALRTSASAATSSCSAQARRLAGALGARAEGGRAISPAEEGGAA